jgi:protein TonB
MYTAEAIRNGIQGSVLLAAVVLPDGTVGEVTVLRSLDTVFGLDAQAVLAAKQWLFNPGMKDGLPVAVRVTIELTFTLI